MHQYHQCVDGGDEEWTANSLSSLCCWAHNMDEEHVNQGELIRMMKLYFGGISLGVGVVNVALAKSLDFGMCNAIRMKKKVYVVHLVY